jgi:hypothetical protein
MNENEKEQQELAEFARRPPAPQPGTGGSFWRGCLIALGIAFLIFAFVVGACFLSF